MTPEDLAKIQARLDATNDARLSHLEWYHRIKVLEVNARRDMARLLGYVAELEQRVAELKDRAARSESPTAYAQIRPANHTQDLPRVEGEGIRQAAGLREALPPVPRFTTLASREDALRVLSQLIEEFKP